MKKPKPNWHIAIYHSTMPSFEQDHHYFQFHVGPTNRFEATHGVHDVHSLNYVPSTTVKIIHQMQVPKRLERELEKKLRKQNDPARPFYLGHIRFVTHRNPKTIAQRGWKVQGNEKPNHKWNVVQAVEFFPKGEPEREAETWDARYDAEEIIAKLEKTLPYFGTWLERACYRWLVKNNFATHVVAAGDQTPDRQYQWTRLGLKPQTVYPIQHVLNQQDHLLERKKPKKN